MPKAVKNAPRVSAVGTRCDVCREIVRLAEIFCQGAKDRGEPMPTTEACRCNHPGDFLCSCGRPCFSIF